jgi:aspartate racemase
MLMTKPVGVLGGMGPLATFDFCIKVVEETGAETDQDNVPLLVHSVPQIPDRIAAIGGAGPSSLPELRRGMRVLLEAGAGCLAMPCNTAHFWQDALAAEAPVPFLHIADAACAVARMRATPGDALGLVATTGTRLAGFYPARLERAGFACLASTEDDQALVNEGIHRVKRGQVRAGGELFAEAVRRLMTRGATTVILGCTEVPPGIDAAAPELAPVCIDATRALARACVNWFRHGETRAASARTALESSPAGAP